LDHSTTVLSSILNSMMQALLRLPAICCILCFFSLDAIHIQVAPSSGNQPLVPKATVPDRSHLNGNMVNDFLSNGVNTAALSNFAKTVNTIAVNQKELNLVSGGACNNTELGDIVTAVLNGMDHFKNMTGGAGMSGMGGLSVAAGEPMGDGKSKEAADPMGAGFPMGAGMPVGPEGMNSKIHTACLAEMPSIMQLDWSKIGVCMNAMLGTSTGCSDCFVKGAQAIMGKTMAEMPTSCNTKCMTGMSTGKFTECQECMTPHMTDMLECVGFDTKAFSQGGAEAYLTPLGGGAGSVLPRWVVTLLLGAVTLGVSSVF